MRVRKPIARTLWATVRPDGDLIPCFRTRRDAIDHATVGEGHNGAAITWRRARDLGWRVVKVRVTEVRR